MPKFALKTAGSWLLMAAMIALFCTASWHLLAGVAQARVEGLMAGGCMMFGAVTLAWLRLWLSDALEAGGEARTSVRWASVMEPRGGLTS
ncbi:hypothetical protein [Marinovum sp.]|uniref:hypothetical protein n=1 Tax=Marinovum sp. TaxID=2024839 RepID=UPI003A934D20